MGPELESWSADTGATTHMTNNRNILYNLRPPSAESAIVYTGDGTELQVRYVGSLDLIFHRAQDVPVTIESVSFLPEIKVNLLSLYAIQARKSVTLDGTGDHLMGGRLNFPKYRAGSRLN